MPKDTEFFARAAPELNLRHAALVAFGATRKAGVARRATTRRCGRCSTPRRRSSCLVAKSDVRHVERALRTTLEENLRDGRRHRRVPASAEGRRVFLDCEHFFDGYRFDPDYRAAGARGGASTAGAEVGVMCDTNGGMLPLGHRRGRRREVADRDRVPARHPLPGRHRLRGRQHRRRGRGRRDARPVHRQRLRRAGRQRRPVRRRRQPRDQARACRSLPDGVPGRDDAGLARHRGDRQHRPRHPPGLRRGRPRSPTRRGCTRARSRSTRCSTTTSTRRSSATTCGSWSPRWPAGPASSSRPRARRGPGRPARRRVGRSSSTVKELEAEGWSFEAADASFELLHARGAGATTARRARSRWSRTG